MTTPTMQPLTRLSVPILALALAAPVLAQGRAIDLVPDGLVVAELDGPGLFRDRFEGTRIAKMLSSSRMNPVLGPVRGLYRIALRQAADMAGDVDVDELAEKLLAYRGRVRVGFDVFGESLDPDAGPPPMGMVIVLSPDGDTDLASIAAAIDEIAGEHAGALTDVEVGGVTWRALVNDQGGGVALPRMVGDSLVMFAGQPLRQSIARSFEHRGQGRYEPPARLASACAGVVVNGRRLMQLIAAGLPARPGGADGPPPVDVLKALGLLDLREMSLTLSAIGEHAALEMVVDGGADAADGALGLYAPARPGRQPALAHVPRQSDFWAVQTFRLDRVWTLAGRVIDAMGEHAEVSLDEIEARFEEQTGQRLREDLIAHLGDAIGYTISGSGLAAMMTDELPDGVCYAIGLRDGEAFERTVRDLLVSAGIDAMFEQEEFKGVTVKTIEPVSALLLHLAISERFALIAVGADGGRLLRDWLTEEAARKAGEAAPDFRKGVAERLEHAPEGWDSAGALTVGVVVETIEAIAEAEGGMPPQARQLTGLVAKLAEDFGLNDIVFASAFAHNALRLRLLW